MKITTRYDKGSTLKARFRDMDRFYDFVTGGWVSTETADCYVALVEYADSSPLTSLYNVVVAVPPGVYNVEILDSSNEVVAAAGTSVDGVQRAVRLSDFTFTMVHGAGSVLTGATITALRKLDGGAFAACVNAPIEIGNGVYAITLEASDLDADVVTLAFSANAAATKVITIKTNQ